MVVTPTAVAKWCCLEGNHQATSDSQLRPHLSLSRRFRWCTRRETLETIDRVPASSTVPQFPGAQYTCDLQDVDAVVSFFHKLPALARLQPNGVGGEFSPIQDRE